MNIIKISLIVLAGYLMMTSVALLTANAQSDAGPVVAESGGDAGAVTPGTVATPTTPKTAEPEVMTEDIIKAVRSGQWRMAASLALGLIMLFLGKVRDKVKWFKGDRGGALLVALLAFAGALSTALASDAPLDWKLLLGTLGVMWTAVGGYSWIKKLIWPAIVPDTTA